MKKVLTILLCVLSYFAVAEAAQVFQYGNHVVGLHTQTKSGENINTCVRVISGDDVAWFTADVHNSYEKGVHGEIVINEFFGKETASAQGTNNVMSPMTTQCLSALDGENYLIAKIGKYNVVFTTDSGVVVFSSTFTQTGGFAEIRL